MDPDRPYPIPEHVQLGTVGSTTDVLLRMAGQDAKAHTLVVAREQTSARGGSGPLHAPPGGLWFSTLWTPGIPVDRAAQVTLAATWGVREGIRQATGIEAGIKWPNDVIIDGQKVAGVTVEGRVDGQMIEEAVIGVGINVNNPIHQMPEPLPEKATSLQQETGDDLDLTGLLEVTTQELARASELVLDPAELVSNVSGCWTQKGAMVSMDTGFELIEGVAIEIDQDAGLVLETEAGTRRFKEPPLAKFTRVVAPNKG